MTDRRCPMGRTKPIPAWLADRRAARGLPYGPCPGSLVAIPAEENTIMQYRCDACGSGFGGAP